MKNQYFGDINDYRKYGLLRSIIRASELRTVICWMLTPDDASRDGRFVDYLDRPEKWAHHDPQLYDTLRSLVRGADDRAVSLLGDTPLLPQATFFSDHVPDDARLRDLWFGRLLMKADPHSVVFLDPDNGIEVPSCPFGRKGSSKYLYWREITSLWATGSSLLIYQHFTREKRSSFVERTRQALSSQLHGSHVEAFITPHVLFLLALQPAHQHAWQGIMADINFHWNKQISFSIPNRQL
jgi:hypothetical protein